MLFAEQTFRKASGQPIFYPQNNFLSVLSDSPVTHKVHSTLHNTSGFQPVSRATSVLFTDKTCKRPGKNYFLFFFLSLFPNLHLLVLRQNMSHVLSSGWIFFPGVRPVLDPTVLFWARFERQNLFEVAGKWSCCWLSGELVGTRGASPGNSPLPRTQSLLRKRMHLSCVRAVFLLEN